MRLFLAANGNHKNRAARSLCTDNGTGGTTGTTSTLPAIGVSGLDELHRLAGIFRSITSTRKLVACGITASSLILGVAEHVVEPPPSLDWIRCQRCWPAGTDSPQFESR